MLRNMRKGLSLFLAFVLLLALMPSATAANHTFDDVRAGQWYTDAVQFVYENNIMAGVGGGRFDPQGDVSRATAAALIFRLHNERLANASDDRDNHFTDVGNTWYAPYITWAYENDIVRGTSATTFNPNGNVTRQEFAVMLHRYVTNMTNFNNWFASPAQWEQFTDREEIASWANSPLHWINSRGIIAGRTATTINPTGTATRAEAAVIMTRFATLLVPLCPEVEMEVKESYLRWLEARVPHLVEANNVTVETIHLHYFGTYSNGVVVMMSSHASPIPVPAIHPAVVGGYLFYTSGGSFLYGFYCFATSSFMRAESALEQGLLSQEEFSVFARRIGGTRVE